MAGILDDLFRFVYVTTLLEFVCSRSHTEYRGLESDPEGATQTVAIPSLTARRLILRSFIRIEV
jgi:hypothetical protein